MANACPWLPAAQQKFLLSFRRPTGAMDLVTETDKECEALILAAIQGAFPSHKFIGEEGSAAQARCRMQALLVRCRQAAVSESPAGGTGVYRGAHRRAHLDGGPPG